MKPNAREGMPRLLLAWRLRHLAGLMEALGADLDYYGGLAAS